MVKHSEFADTLKMLRSEKHLPLRALAEATGWSVAYLSELERGAKQPPLPSAQTERLAEVLGVPSADMARMCLMGRKSLTIRLDGLPSSSKLLVITMVEYLRNADRGMPQDLVDIWADLCYSAYIQEEYKNEARMA